MLGLRQFVYIWFVFASIHSFALTPKNRGPYVMHVDSESSVFLDLKERMENETDLQAMVDLIKQLKILADAQGLQFPNLTVFLTAIREKLATGSLEIDDATYEWLYDEFLAFQDYDAFCWNPIKHKDRNKKHRSKEVKISTKTALGFLKFMGGTLMCIIPVPLVQGAGAALAVVGISDMVDGCKDHKSDSGNAEERMHSLKPLPSQ